jgi:uncharacterized protein (TIRG00374 family)
VGYNCCGCQHSLSRLPAFARVISKTPTQKQANNWRGRVTIMIEHRADSTARARHRSWGFWLGTVISLGCLIWAIGALDWSAVGDALARANPLWVGVAVLTVLLTIAVRLARWAILLYPRSLQSSNLLAAMLVGQLLNYFTPARAGDVARAYLLGHTEGESKAWALGTVALEKIWDIWALLILIGVLGFSTRLPDWLVTPTRGLLLLAFLVLALSWLILKYRSKVVAGVAWLSRFLPPGIATFLNDNAARLLDGFGGLQRPRVWFWAAVWSAATWGIGSLTNHTVLLALGLSLPFTASLMLLVVLQMGVAVPSLPGRVGIFEGLCIVVLALFGVDRDAAFAAGLVLHAVVFVPPILLGLFFAWRIKGISL